MYPIRAGEYNSPEAEQRSADLDRIVRHTGAIAQAFTGQADSLTGATVADERFRAAVPARPSDRDSFPDDATREAERIRRAKAARAAPRAYNEDCAEIVARIPDIPELR
ncbi:hypothetical protein [Nocardia ignorata]|uniref:Uncharacterized protein n=1 Tax=Nocardia ignorata TaxID=145285 RepID=A0A4R6NZ39_NOCIG|nr:hypothetical protein [Nocardia ignorata]TDP30608.1 hypothetical protein DFR75_11172 [Nocardia ignorata]